MDKDCILADDEIKHLVAWHSLVRNRRVAPRVERDIWLADARRGFTPSQRCGCVVCGKFKGVTQAHHVVPLTAQYDRGYVEPDHEYVWMCPNHHTLLHLFIPGDNRSMNRQALRARSRTASAQHKDLSDEEFEALMRLVTRSARAAP
jgi:hypothetical protein